MEHLSFNATPITPLPYFSEKYNVELLAKRDDLFSSALGGSKARMLQYILYPLLSGGAKTIVTAGGPCSNFNRALSLLCANYGLKMILVSYTDEPDEYKTSLNNFVVSLTNCEYVYCKKTEVPQTIENVMNRCDKATTRFIYGGGKSLQGIYAYYDAVRELSHQVSDIDELFVACGTGTTLTGICAGMQKYFPKAKVHGISVARTYEAELPVLTSDMEILNQYLHEKFDFSNLVYHDDFLNGGYSKTSLEELRTIQECISHEGLIIDPTYARKAFWGMTSILEKRDYKNKKILFWNTGGLMNLLSQKDEFIKIKE